VNESSSQSSDWVFLPSLLFRPPPPFSGCIDPRFSPTWSRLKKVEKCSGLNDGEGRENGWADGKSEVGQSTIYPLLFTFKDLCSTFSALVALSSLSIGFLTWPLKNVIFLYVFKVIKYRKI